MAWLDNPAEYNEDTDLSFEMLEVKESYVDCSPVSRHKSRALIRCFSYFGNTSLKKRKPPSSLLMIPTLCGTRSHQNCFLTIVLLQTYS